MFRRTAVTGVFLWAAMAAKAQGPWANGAQLDPETSAKIGKTWEVVEYHADNWRGTWTRRGDTNVFDCTWKADRGGGGSDVIYLQRIEGGKIYLVRPALSLTYTGALAADGRSVVTGTRSDYSPSHRWTATFIGGAQAESTEHVWEYVRTEAGISKYGGGCYPDRLLSGLEGAIRAESFFAPECSDGRMKPLPRSRYLMEWALPPLYIHPSKPISVYLKTTLVENTQPTNNYDGKLAICFRGAPPPAGSCSGRPWAAILGNPHHAGDTVVFDSKQKPPAEQVLGPPERWGLDARYASPGREMRLNIAAELSSTFWYSYVYRLVPLSSVRPGAGPVGRTNRPLRGEEEGPSPPPIPPPAADSLGSVWKIREENQQGQGCNGTWTRQGTSKVFDARWQCMGGLVTDVLEIESVNGNQIVVYRRGLRNRYYLNLSSDRSRIVSGRINWAPDWRISGTIE